MSSGSSFVVAIFRSAEYLEVNHDVRVDVDAFKVVASRYEFLEVLSIFKSMMTSEEM